MGIIIVAIHHVAFYVDPYVISCSPNSRLARHERFPRSVWGHECRRPSGNNIATKRRGITFLGCLKYKINQQKLRKRKTEAALVNKLYVGLYIGFTELLNSTGLFGL